MTNNVVNQIVIRKNDNIGIKEKSTLKVSYSRHTMGLKY